eukprot:COSAG01_NODE_17928_length_1113_cov_3.272189_1_plen_158_part_10
MHERGEVRMRYGNRALSQKFIKRMRRVDESWERQTTPRVYIIYTHRVEANSRVISRNPGHSAKTLLGLITSRGKRFEPSSRLQAHLSFAWGNNMCRGDSAAYNHSWRARVSTEQHACSRPRRSRSSWVLSTPHPQSDPQVQHKKDYGSTFSPCLCKHT